MIVAVKLNLCHIAYILYATELNCRKYKNSLTDLIFFGENVRLFLIAPLL